MSTKIIGYRGTDRVQVLYSGIVTARCLHVCYMILSFLHSLIRKGFQRVDRGVIKKVGIKKVGGHCSIKLIFYIAFISKKNSFTKESSSTGQI